MKITFRRCGICGQMHNHLSCRYCGALRVGRSHIDVATGRELVRGFALPRILSAQVDAPISYSYLVERVVPKLVAR